MTILVKPAKAKARFPILVTLFGMTTVCIFATLSNAESPILVTVYEFPPLTTVCGIIIGPTAPAAQGLINVAFVPLIVNVNV
jgi:hypothetical protein